MRSTWGKPGVNLCATWGHLATVYLVALEEAVDVYGSRHWSSLLTRVYIAEHDAAGVIVWTRDQGAGPPLRLPGGCSPPESGHGRWRARRAAGRSSHSSTFRFNISAFCRIEGAFRGCSGGVLEVLGGIWGCSGYMSC